VSSVAGVFNLHGITEAGMATVPFGSWWQAARHGARNRVERWVLTTSVVAARGERSGTCYSYMFQHNDDTLVTCNGVLLVIEGATLEAVKAAWMSVADLDLTAASRKATSNWPALPTFDSK
jgi:hypothetical protein